MSNGIENKSMKLQTKVTPEVYARLNAIGEKYGFTIFQLLRMMCDCIVRYMDDQHNLSDDLIRVVRMFKDIKSWGKSICLADEDQELTTEAAFYILRAKDKSGFRIVWVEGERWRSDENGNKVYAPDSTCNVQLILDRFIEYLDPMLYKYLRQLAGTMGTESLLDCINRLADLYKEDPFEKEMRIEFENNDWHMGAKMHNRETYRRTRHAKADDIYSGQQSLFNNDTNN